MTTRILRAALLIGLLSLPALLMGQGRPVSLEEAVALFQEHSLDRELARLRSLRAKGEAIQYRAYPNPEFSMTREQLNAGTLDYQETSYLLSQPLELLGQPFLRSRASSHMSEAADLQYAFERRQLTRRVKELYAELWYQTRKLEVYERTLAVVRDARRSAQARKAEGTFSGLQLQRFNVELSRYRRLRDETELARRETRNALRILVYGDSRQELDWRLADSLVIRNVDMPKSRLVQRALESRGDLQAGQRLSQASRLQVRVQKKERLPDINLTLGYKNQSDGSEGIVIGGSLRLPVFNRNRGDLAVARAEARSRSGEMALLRSRIRSEVENAYDRVQLIEGQWESMQETRTEFSMLEAARSAYAEGSYSLVELLDATRAWVDGRILVYETLADFNQARFALDALTAGSLSNPTNTQQP